MVFAAQQVDRRVPTIEDLLKVESVGSVEISPDGSWVAYTIRRADFDENADITQIWLSDTKTGESFQLTRGKKSAADPKWSPDGRWLAFTSRRDTDENQIYAIRPNGGEAIQLTESESSVTSFSQSSNYEWSPDGKSIAFTAREPESKELKNRKEHMGEYAVVRGEYKHSHIWTFEVTDAFKKPVKGKQRTKGEAFNVGGFSWSPNGMRIAFSATINPDLIQYGTSDIYILNLRTNEVKKIVSQAGPDRSPHWSPDGRQIIFDSYMGKERYRALNSKLAIVPAEGGTPRSLTDAFDEHPQFVDWNKDGIYFWALQKTASHLFRIDPGSGEIARVTKPNDLIAFPFSMTENGEKVAFVAGSPTSLREVYVSQVGSFSPKMLTMMTDQVREFILGTREVVSWKSRDGTVIEGVLTKPADFDPAKKYPLLCIIHGGPAGGIEFPVPRFRGYYPEEIWAARGALILRVNYRGGAGYGEKFRTLNMRNLGVGDAWDVLSGVDYLINRGWVDPDKVGCMGWSQGGYISAFLTASSDRFAAISVGAGTSNWATYYYNTDFTTFTIGYLGDDPVDDPEIYEKTSPMTYIKNARTPTLIQHGEFDRRVPIPNAYELRQGLEDRAVPVEMVVYKGFGHRINKPKSRRAVIWHNLVWFNHYLWGDALPDLTEPEVPEEEEEDKNKEKE
jgi:dipeptidyl aminopeptidase/acylaminoacyl peptidase